MALKKHEILAQTPLFAEVTTDDLEELAQVSDLRRFADGDILFHAGERADGFHIVVEGEIEVFRTGPQLREQILHLFGEGEICGEVPLFSGSAYPASARAKGELYTLFIPGDQFIDIAQRHPAMLLDMLAVLSMRLRRFANIIADLSLKDVQARLANYLLELRRRQASDCVELDASKREIASRLGTIQETLSRGLNKLRTCGAITVHGATITVNDPAALESIAGGE